MRHLCAVIATALLAGSAFADTINVPGDQPAIAAAISASVNGDVINIAAGTYNESNLNPGGKAITIQGTLNGDGTLATTIDAQQNGSVFVINSSEGNGTVIKDLVITGGLANYGGGIYCYNSSNPVIENCLISNNSTNYQGGGVYCSSNSVPNIVDCYIVDNNASQGGGLYLFSGNCLNMTVRDNTASEAGGLYCNEGNLTIIGCTIDSNAPTNYQANENSSLTILTLPPASPSGACCVSYGCHALTETACAGISGTWLGEVSSCDDCAPTCQGDANADGVVDVFDLLKVIDGWGTCP